MVRAIDFSDQWVAFGGVSSSVLRIVSATATSPIVGGAQERGSS